MTTIQQLLYTLGMEKSPDRSGDWLEAGLLFLLIQVAAARLVTTGWAPNLYFAESIAALGTLLGLALGVSRFSRRILIWFVVDYTVVVLPWHMTGAADPQMYFWDQILEIANRLFISLGQFMQHQPVKDSFFFVACVSLGFWLVGLAAGYWLMRHHNLLVAILPAGIALLTVQIYDDFFPRRSWWLAVSVLLALLLLGREYYLRSHADWIKRRIVVNEEAWSDIFSGLLTTVVLSVILAWTIPTSLSSLQSAAETWNDFTQPIRDRLSNAVSSLKSSSSIPGAGSYTDTLALGTVAATADTTTFTVHVMSVLNVTPRYYWRGRVYDNYSNGQWTSSPAANMNFNPTQGDLVIPNTQDRSLVQFQFNWQSPSQNLLYAPSQPVWTDKPGTVQSTAVDKTQSDLLSWQAIPPVQKGGVYQVKSEIADPDVDSLRAAGMDYPQWVTDRYLEIPDDVKADIQSLAENLTANQTTPYDKSMAITNYLRSAIQYTTSIESPPDGRDPILWVLFDYKKGFCNYYASAEVMMLRSIGIPSRLAVGFAQGEYDSNTNTYIVRARDAHAWPEVYFPNTGWVEFEPTTSQNPLIRPEAPASVQDSVTAPPVRPKPLGEGQNLPDVTGQVGSINPPSPFIQTTQGRVSLVGLSALIILLLLLVLLRYRLISRLPVYLSKSLEHGGIQTPAWIENWARWNQLPPVEKAFSSVNLSLWWLGKPQPINATPAERASALIKQLPSATSAIQAVTAELEIALFTRRRADISRARRAGMLILFHALRARLQRAWDTFNGAYDDTR